VDDARRRLGLEQAALVACVTSLAPTPNGLDSHRIAATRRVLELKRLRTVTRAWPSLRPALGEDFERVAGAVLATVPMAARFHDVVDGLAIAKHCHHIGAINDSVRLALLDFGVSWTCSGGAFRRRSWPWFGATVLPDSRRIAVAIRLRRTHTWLFPHWGA
jgi:hypothetical protein